MTARPLAVSLSASGSPSILTQAFSNLFPVKGNPQPKAACLTPGIAEMRAAD